MVGFRSGGTPHIATSTQSRGIIQPHSDDETVAVQQETGCVQVAIALFRRQPIRLSAGEDRSCQRFVPVGRMTSFKVRR